MRVLVAAILSSLFAIGVWTEPDAAAQVAADSGVPDASSDAARQAPADSAVSDASSEAAAPVDLGSGVSDASPEVADWLPDSDNATGTYVSEEAGGCSVDRILPGNALLPSYLLLLLLLGHQLVRMRRRIVRTRRRSTAIRR